MTWGVAEKAPGWDNCGMLPATVPLRKYILKHDKMMFDIDEREWRAQEGGSWRVRHLHGGDERRPQSASRSSYLVLKSAWGWNGDVK